MNITRFSFLICLGCVFAVPAADEGFVPIFDGKTLNGWHVSAKTGHSGASKHTTGGRWVVEKGAVVGSQDIPGNGGIIITDEQFGDYEIVLEMNNDFGPDSGLFLRSTEDGKAWQAMIDYHSGGNLMGVYGEGLGGKPHVRNFSFKDKVTEIDPTPTGEPPTPLPVLPESWPFFWRHGQWNELRAHRAKSAEDHHVDQWRENDGMAGKRETPSRHGRDRFAGSWWREYDESIRKVSEYPCEKAELNV